MRILDILKKESPLLLTIGGVATLLVGTYMAVKESPKVKESLEELKEKEDSNVSKFKHAVNVAGTVITNSPKTELCLTIGTTMIFSGYGIHSKRLATATAIGSTAVARLAQKQDEFKIYENKVSEVLGKAKNEKIRNEVVSEVNEKYKPDISNDTWNARDMDGVEAVFDDWTKAVRWIPVSRLEYARQLCKAQFNEIGEVTLMDWYYAVNDDGIYDFPAPKDAELYTWTKRGSSIDEDPFVYKFGSMNFGTVGGIPRTALIISFSEEPRLLGSL
jgi:hypothetical protein